MLDLSALYQPIISFVIALLERILREIRPFGRPKDRFTIETPKKTIKVTLCPKWNTDIWEMGLSFGKPAMRLEGVFLVTNIARCNVAVTQVRLRKPKMRGRHLVQSIRGTTRDGWASDYPILCGCWTYIKVRFDITPPLKKEGESFFGDLVIIDHLDNKHWIKKVEFEYKK